MLSIISPPPYPMARSGESHVVSLCQLRRVVCGDPARADTAPVENTAYRRQGADLDPAPSVTCAEQLDKH